MTTYQEIALLFPVIGALGAMVTAFGIKAWVERKYPETSDEKAASDMAFLERSRIKAPTTESPSNPTPAKHRSIT
jgi:hypothetical protein